MQTGLSDPHLGAMEFSLAIRTIERAGVGMVTEKVVAVANRLPPGGEPRPGR